MKTTRLQYSCLEERNLLACLACPDSVAIADNNLVVHTGAFDCLGEEESEAFDVDFIVDGNGEGVSQDATVTINGANDPPIVEGPLKFEFSQNDGVQSIDLLEGASDPDGDELNVSDLRASSTTPPGTAFAGNSLDVRTGAYSYLGEGESETFEIRYLIVDGNGGNVAQVVTVTINGASDPAGDELNVSDRRQVGSVPPAGTTIAGNSLVVHTGAFDYLGEGESEAFDIDFIVDGNGEGVSQVATVTINGANDPPIVDGPLEFKFFANDGVQTIDLLEGASDPDGDELNVSDRRQVGSVPPAGTTIAGNSLVVRTGAFDYLGEGESETFDIEYFIVDGNGRGVGQVVTVTINGATDPPVVDGPLEFKFFANDGVQTIDLLEGASDPAGDELIVSDRRQVGSVPPAGTTIAGNSLVVRTGAFDYLGEGESETFDIEYFIVDGNGRGVGQVVTVTINGAQRSSSWRADARERLIEDLVVEETGQNW